jgi:tetratricopeptide (TPR) repeat protein
MTNPMSSVPNDIGARVRLLREYASERAELGDAAEVHRAGDGLVSLDDDELSHADPGITRDMLDAAPSLLVAGDFRRAEILLLKGIRALSVNPQATQADLIVPLNNLMAVYDQSGDHNRRSQIAAAIGSIAEQLQEPLTAGAAHVLLQLGQLFEQRGNIGSALVMYRPVHSFMTSRTDMEADALLAWLISYARALIAGGRYDDVVDVCEKALGIVSNGQQIEVLAIMAMATSRKRDAAATGAALDRAVAIADAIEAQGEWPDHRMEAAAGAAYHNLAGHYLGAKQRDMYPRAQELMRRALAIVLRRGGQGSAEHAGALGQLAVITEARGDLDAAERLFRDSIAVYESARDTENAEFSDFLTDFGLMQLRRGRAIDAVTPFQRAVELRDATPGESPSRRADAVSNLATAHFEAGDLTAAEEEYRRALEIRFAG